MAEPALSVVVPVYNGAATLAELAGRVDAALGGDYELVLVNDGSADGSWQAIEALVAEQAHVRRALRQHRLCVTAHAHRPVDHPAPASGSQQPRDLVHEDGNVNR